MVQGEELKLDGTRPSEGLLKEALNEEVGVATGDGQQDANHRVELSDR